MAHELAYYSLATVLLLANCAALVATLFSMPGNWLIVLLTALFAWYPSSAEGSGVTWSVVAVIAVLAVLGEIVEMLASAAGAAKQGASRRAILLAIIGAVAGSLAGSLFCLPIPVVGPIVGALFGGAIGSFAGALAGEVWKGKSSHDGMRIGKAAFLGRLWGTVGKLGIGAVMVVIVAIDAFLI